MEKSKYLIGYSSIFSLFDVDNSGSIDFHEFILYNTTWPTCLVGTLRIAIHYRLTCCNKDRDH